MLNQVNNIRLQNGFRPLTQIWCKICRQANTHFYWNCPNRVCRICNGQHVTSQCPSKFACQWCGSLQHTSNLCNNQQGLILKASANRKCSKCNRFGHIARECHAVNKKRLKRPRFLRRFRRRRRRRY